MSDVTSSTATLPAQRYKRCPTCDRLTPADSMRCYECWNDVASVPILEATAASRALARQQQIDGALLARRATSARRIQRLKQASLAVFAAVTAWYGYWTFIYQPPPVALGTRPTLQLVAGPDVWAIDAGDAGGTRTTAALTAATEASTTAWTRELGASPVGPLIASASLVYAALEDGRIVALDVRTGTPAWTHQLPNHPVAGPTLAGDRLYVPQIAGRLLVLDATTGTPLLESPAATTSFTTSPLVADGIAYIFGSGQLLAFDATSGARLWSHPIASNWAFVTPVLSGPHIAVATGNRTLIFDRLAGQQTYYYEFERAQPFSIVVADDTIYTLSARFGAAIDVDSRRPWWESGRAYWNQLWIWSMAPEPPPPPSIWVTRRPARDGFPAAVAADRLRVAGAEGDLRALSRADGTPLWQVRTPPIAGAPTLAADGLLVVHAQSLALYDAGDGHLLSERPLGGDADLDSAIVTSHGTYALAKDGRLTALRR